MYTCDCFFFLLRKIICDALPTSFKIHCDANETERAFVPSTYCYFGKVSTETYGTQYYVGNWNRSDSSDCGWTLASTEKYIIRFEWNV